MNFTPMKLLQILCFIIATGFTLTLSAQDTKATQETALTQGPSMTFDAPNIDIGTIKKGEKKAMEFHFTNTGTEDLKIEIVSGCECTTLDWPRLPIKPGGSGIITALFDSTEKEHSETVDIDINLENIDPKSGYAMFERVTYTFELVE